VLTANILQCSF